jgi:hypothetical protein
MIAQAHLRGRAQALLKASTLSTSASVRATATAAVLKWPFFRVDLLPDFKSCVA